METSNLISMYTVDYFLNKFSAIPEDRWYIGDFSNEDKNKFCALGLCGCDGGKRIFTGEASALYDLFKVLHKSPFMVGRVNDGIDPNYQQPTAKQRIIAALYDIKKMQQKQLEVNREDITKQLAVLPIGETSDLKKELVNA
jgi:hypothetical protein